MRTPLTPLRGDFGGQAVGTPVETRSINMITILIIVLVIALLGGGLGYGRFGAAGMSPAALIGIILVVLLLTGRL